MPFQAGYNKGVTFLILGAGGSPVSLNVTGHSWAEAIDKLDVTHSGTGGIQALIAGILRGDGNITANVDSSFAPGSVLGVRAGVKGVFTLALGTPSPITVPAMITKVNYASKVEGKVEYNFDVSLDSLTGTYVAP